MKKEKQTELLNSEIKETLNINNTLFETSVLSENFSYLVSTTKIFIPTKILKVITNYISKEDLLLIDKDIEAAKEYLLIFISFLIRTEYTDNNTFVNLLTERLLMELFNANNKRTQLKLKSIISILEKGTELKGSIIEVNKSYQADMYSRSYSLSPTYQNKGIVSYQLTSNKVKKVAEKKYFNELSKTITNPIAQHIIKTYGKITIPTEYQVKLKINKMIKDGYTNKVGKLLVKFDGVSDKDRTKFIYDDDIIARYTKLFSEGFIVPIIGDEKSGGRVVDSFTLINSFIRNMCLIDGKPMTECDYKCLHPNICVSKFGGKTKFLTHDKVADDMNITREEVKKSHLSFFNWNSICFKTHKLFDYYNSVEPKMMENIIKLKDGGDIWIKKGKKTEIKNIVISKIIFGTEVELMTSILKQLTKLNINCIYVYDALYCNPKDFKEVKKIMNTTALKMNIYTKVN